MNKYLVAAGWALAVVMAAYSWFRITSLEDSRRALQADRDALLNAQTGYTGELARQERTIADLRNKLQSANEDLLLAMQEQAETTDTGEPEEFALAGPGSRPGPGRRARELVNSPRFQELTSQMQVNARYGSFINSLGLDPADREELNSLLMDVFNRQTQLRIQLANGEISQDYFARAMAELNMEDAMAGFLTPDEMNAYYDWQAQEETRNQQQMQEALKMQLTAQTPGFTDANRSRLAELLSRNTLVTAGVPAGGRGAFFAIQQGRGGDSDTGEPPSPERLIASQRESLDSIRLELQGTMADDQLAIVESYLDQQETQLELMQEVMANNGGGPVMFRAGNVIEGR